jgi:hypothetical protein
MVACKRVSDEERRVTAENPSASIKISQQSLNSSGTAKEDENG